MATDDERREAARRLREFADAYSPSGAVVTDGAESLARFFRAVGFDQLDRANWTCFGDGKIDLTPACARRLADLIEPPEGHETLDVSDNVSCGTRVDRDALLALADEMDRYGNEVRYPTINGYAKRIREVLGVSE